MHDEPTTHEGAPHMTPTRPTIGQLTAHNLAVDITPTPRDHADDLGPFTGQAACSCRGWSSGMVSGSREWVNTTIRDDHARHVANTTVPGHAFRRSVVGSEGQFTAYTSCSCGEWLAAYEGGDPDALADAAAAGHDKHLDAVNNRLPAWTRDWSAVVDNDGLVTTTRPELADRLRAAGLTVAVIGQ